MKLGVLVSGGDAPGINAVLYHAWRAAAKGGAALVGFHGGFQGILDSCMQPLEALDSSLVSSAGSLLSTGRCEAFREEPARRRVCDALRKNGLDGLVVIGGNGSLTGARLLGELGFPVIGVPATVDGDVFSTETAVGFATAVQSVSSSLSALHNTAAAYPGRIFLLETLGGKKGYLALMSGLASAADMIVIPETHPTAALVAEKADRVLRQRGSVIGVVCEGADPAWKNGDQNCIRMYGESIQEKTGVRVRYSVAGYGLRGEAPVCEDRLFGSWCGHTAVEALLAGKSGQITGRIHGEYRLVQNDPGAGGFQQAHWLATARQFDVLPE